MSKRAEIAALKAYPNAEQPEKELALTFKGYVKKNNNFINTYGGNITTLTVPTANKIVEATDINNLNEKVNEFKKNHNINDNTKVFLILGRLAKEKGGQANESNQD